GEPRRGPRQRRSAVGTVPADMRTGASVSLRGRSCRMPMHRMRAMSGYVHGIDEGAAYDWHGARVVIKASAEDTFGQLGVMESTYPPGLSVPSHHHVGEDEMLYVLAGEMQGFCDDSDSTAT